MILKINDRTCSKKLENHTYIELVITNEPKYFPKFITIETGLSDFHKMIPTVLKTYVKKQILKINRLLKVQKLR